MLATRVRLRNVVSIFFLAPMRTAFLYRRASILLNRSTSLCNIPTNSSSRVPLNTESKSHAFAFPCIVGLMTDILRSLWSISRVIQPFSSRRRINRVIIALSLLRLTASCPGVVLPASTQRTSTFASCMVMPNGRKRRSSDVCNLMDI